MKKKLAILGSTGSIGKTLINIIKKNKKSFKVVLLTADKNYIEILKQAKILNVKKKNALKDAINLGIAMQLTNIARDVIEDNTKNRKYIESNFSSIKNTLTIADSFYKSSFLSISNIPISYRFAILVARRVYRQIGRNILNKRNIENYNKSGKIYVSSFGKFFQTIFSIFDFFILLIVNSKKHDKEPEHQIISEEINLNERI